MRHTGAVRIALVHYTYLPTIAGVELVMAEHARLFQHHGHTVTVVADRMPVEAAASQVGLAIPELSPHSPLAVRVARELSSGGIGLVFEQAIGELIAILRPIFATQDIVMLHNVATMHFHLALTAAVWRLAEELPRVRFVCWIHDLAACNPDYAPLPLDREPWALLARPHPRFEYVAVSELRAGQFRTTMAQPPDRCRTIPNGVNPTTILDLSPRLADLAAAYRILDRDFVLLHPTRLLRRKNVELTLRVTAELRTLGRSCLTLITAPPEVQSGANAAYVAELRDLQAELDLAADAPFLHDAGPLSSGEMRELYQLADALFFPSRQEGFGLPLLEAALHRLPVFCSAIEPLRSLLPSGVTTFDPDATPASIAYTVATTLAAQPAHLARRHTLRNLSWPAIYRNFLSPLLGESEPQPTV